MAEVKKAVKEESPREKLVFEKRGALAKLERKIAAIRDSPDDLDALRHRVGALQLICID